MLRFALLAALLLLAPASAQASLPPALPAGANASFDASEAPAGAYTLDPQHASVIWRVRHTGLGLFTARFDKVQGRLDFNPAAPESSRLDITIDANSVSTNVDQDFNARIARLVGARDHPQIHFVSTEIARTGPTTGEITGDLTLNGVTHPATFEAVFEGGASILIPRGGKYVLAFSARTILKRSDWRVSDLLIDSFAADDVEILVEVEFVKA